MVYVVIVTFENYKIQQQQEKELVDIYDGDKIFVSCCCVIWVIKSKIVPIFLLS